MTTFGLKAECGRLIEYDTVADLAGLYARGELHGVLPLGGGSNMLFTTGRYDGTVLHCCGNEVTVGRNDDGESRGELPAGGFVRVDAMAGCTLDHLCRVTAGMGLWGLENLSGIPGEIGGAAVQNVGAYGAEFKDVVESVSCFDISTGKTVRLNRSECHYGYRDSVFKRPEVSGRLIVTSVTLLLSASPAPKLGYAPLAERFAGIPTEAITPVMLRDTVIALRQSKLPDPAQTGSAGSFFKNPVVGKEIFDDIAARAGGCVPGHPAESGKIKLSAAWLIDNAGCKGLTRGGAAVWERQPLVIVNATGNATGHDVVALEEAVRKKVSDRFGIDLQPEVIHIG